jgi:adenylate cyclase
LAATLYISGDFGSARQYAIHGVQIWRSGCVQSHPEDFDTPVVGCLCYEAMCEWHFGEIASSRTAIAEAISLAKELNDANALASALHYAAMLAHRERNLAEIERLASEMIELSTRYNIVYFVTFGAILRGWVRTASGDTAEGITRIENGIRDYRTSGSIASLPFYLILKAEALHLADRASEALDAILEAEALVEKPGFRNWHAEINRLHGLFLAATTGADEAQIEASFCAAIRTAKQQKSISLEKGAQGTYAEYRRQKASGSGGHGFRLPLW